MKKRQGILAIDIGTNATKAVVFDTRGKDVLIHRKFYPMISPQIGWSEQNPDTVFQAVIEIIRETYETKPDDVEIAGISFSSQMYSILAINRQGKPLINSLTWADRRSADIAKTMRQHPEAQGIYRRTGCPIDAIYPLSKIQWLKEHAEDMDSARFISIKEYVLYRLIGKFVVDWSVASATGFFDISRYTWDQKALSLIAVSPAQLSELVSPRQVFTEWNSDVLNYAHIPSGTPCVIGGGDGPLASIGVGASQPGVLAVNVGTSAAARYILCSPLVDPNGRLWTYIADENVWVIGGITSSGGILYEWLTKIMASDESHEAIDALVSSINPGADGLLFIPYLGGEQCPVWDPNTRGSFIGIAFKHTKAHFIRAVFEGIARSIYRIVESIESTIEQRIQEIRVTGGMASSAKWLQIAADMFGCRIVVPETIEGSAKGAALLARAALGMASEPLDQQESRHPTLKTFEPHEDKHRVYATQYNHFTKLLEAVKVART
ncbi:MAG: gluconokinase [Syntrophobacterales bacterium]|nr:MAG: gluconokinase [Syntrophobacterales bacterium]